MLWGGGGRVQQSYLDFAPLLIRRWQWAPHGLNDTMTSNLALIEGNFFLGTSTIILRPTLNNTALAGLIVTGNTFQNSGNNGNANSSFVLDESGGKFSSVHDVVIENNEASSGVVAAGKLSTRATKTALIQASSTEVTLDFQDVLIFGLSSMGAHVHLSVCCSFYTSLS